MIDPATIEGLASAEAAARLQSEGVHFPSDVLSGICLGAGWAFVIDAVGVGFAPDGANP